MKLRSRDLGYNWQAQWKKKDLKNYVKKWERVCLKYLMKEGEPFTSPVFEKTIQKEFKCCQPKKVFAKTDTERQRKCQKILKTFKELCEHLRFSHVPILDFESNTCQACEKIYETLDEKVCVSLKLQRKRDPFFNL